MEKVEEETGDRKRYRAMKKGVVFRPKKRLGQHFLVDREVIQKIITLAEFQPGDQVLEVGPGQGALTLPLARSVGHVVAVEKDSSLANFLEKRLAQTGCRNVTIINCDILSFDFHDLALTSGTKSQVIGNLPYNISSPFLEKLIVNQGLFSRAVLMLQLEVAERLTASPGGKTFGALSLLIQYHAYTRKLLGVSKKAFYPRPKVDSMVLELNFERPCPRPDLAEDDFRKVVKCAFSQRRKTILNALKGLDPDRDREELLAALKTCGIDPKARAESLGMDDFLSLTDALRLTRDRSSVN